MEERNTMSTFVKFCVSVTTFSLVLPPMAEANKHAKLLYNDILWRRGYNPLIRPVENYTDRIIVTMGIKLSQLIDLDERNQIMTTNLWVEQEWRDPTLTWKPEDYGGVDLLYMPAENIWHPDIVLYNNGEGIKEMTQGTKATLYYNGQVKWRPPATLKSSCTIDVRYFPFDEQFCEMRFGSWTYDINEVDILHVWQANITYNEKGDEILTHGINLDEFYRSVEWDIMEVPAQKGKTFYAGSDTEFREWTFKIRLKRKFLFYTINLIIPLVSHALLTILVFYLPSDSREKISLCINILLSLTVYFLMLAEIIPPTSIVVPLLAEYLLFTMILVTSSVIITGITLNVHFRSVATHEMPNWMRKIFLYILPRILMMRRPKIENSHDIELKRIKLQVCTCLSEEHNKFQHHNFTTHNSTQKYQFGSKRTRTQMELINLSRELDEDDILSGARRMSQFCPEVQKAIDGAIFIANHLKEEDEKNRTKEDWKYMALVLDRVFLYVFFCVCLAGTIGIICKAPMIFDERVPIVTWNENDSISLSM